MDGICITQARHRLQNSHRILCEVTPVRACPPWTMRRVGAYRHLGAHHTVVRKVWLGDSAMFVCADGIPMPQLPSTPPSFTCPCTRPSSWIQYLNINATRLVESSSAGGTQRVLWLIDSADSPWTTQLPCRDYVW